MAAIADSGNGSNDGSAAHVEDKGAGGSGSAAPWIEHALRGAEDLKQAVTVAAETAFQVAGSSADEITKTVTSSTVSAMQLAGSSLSWAFSAYSETLDVAKVIRGFLNEKGKFSPFLSSSFLLNVWWILSRTKFKWRETIMLLPKKWQWRRSKVLFFPF